MSWSSTIAKPDDLTCHYSTLITSEHTVFTLTLMVIETLTSSQEVAPERSNRLTREFSVSVEVVIVVVPTVANSVLEPRHINPGRILNITTIAIRALVGGDSCDLVIGAGYLQACVSTGAT